MSEAVKCTRCAGSYLTDEHGCEACDLKGLLAEQEETIANHRALLRRIEWAAGDHWTCPECHTSQHQGHVSTCKLKALLDPTPTNPTTKEQDQCD